MNPTNHAPPEEPAPGEVVLLVEDHKDVMQVLSAALRNAGYHVLEARHGDEALEVSAAHPGPVHLLVTDVVMPRMSGPELAERLRARYPDLRVVYMSGYSALETEAYGLLDAGHPFLQKPFSPSFLTEKARALLAGGKKNDEGGRPTDPSPGPGAEP